MATGLILIIKAFPGMIDKKHHKHTHDTSLFLSTQYRM